MHTNDKQNRFSQIITTQHIIVYKLTINMNFIELKTDHHQTSHIPTEYIS